MQGCGGGPAREDQLDTLPLQRPKNRKLAMPFPRNMSNSPAMREAERRASFVTYSTHPHTPMGAMASAEFASASPYSVLYCKVRSIVVWYETVQCMSPCLHSMMYMKVCMADYINAPKCLLCAQRRPAWKSPGRKICKLLVSHKELQQTLFSFPSLPLSSLVFPFRPLQRSAKSQGCCIVAWHQP